MIGSSTLIILLASVGFVIAFYIHHKARSGEKMVCYIGGDCGDVIKSDYAKFFGIPNTALGMMYFAVVALSYAAHLVYPWLGAPLFIFWMTSLTSIAFLFSLYLVFIQAVVIKDWCEWCLVAAFISASIFGISIYEYSAALLPVLAANRELLSIIHIFAAAIGVGAATITDVFFFKFLKDFRISEEEADILGTISNVIWVMLAFIVLSGIGLYLPNAAVYNETPKFLVKMIIVAVLILNGAFLNLLIAPRLVTISFGEPHAHKKGELHWLRKLAFALGAVSITSWYSAFLLGAYRSWPYGFEATLLMYLSVLVVSVAASQFMEYQIERRSRL
jgi:uncharacterized membrane protein